MTDDFVARLRAEDPETGLRWSIASEAADRIEQLEAQVSRLRAAMDDIVSYVSRADYYYMEPQTIEVLREILGGGRND